MSEDKVPSSRAGGILAGGGLIGGLGALVGASCCILPILLVQAGVSTALVAHLGLFARAKPYLLIVTVLLILVGFLMAFWGGRRPRPTVFLLLVGASVAVVVAIGMPHYEGLLLDWVRGR